MTARATHRGPQATPTRHRLGDVEKLRSRVLRSENATLRSERDKLVADKAALAGEVARAKTRIGVMAAKVEELRRAAKRQAAPFSRGTRKRGGAVRAPENGRGWRPHMVLGAVLWSCGAVDATTAITEFFKLTPA